MSNNINDYLQDWRDDVATGRSRLGFLEWLHYHSESERLEEWQERLSELEGEAVSRYDDLHPEGISWGEVHAAQAEGFGLDEYELDELNQLREVLP